MGAKAADAIGAGLAAKGTALRDLGSRPAEAMRPEAAGVAASRRNRPADHPYPLDIPSLSITQDGAFQTYEEMRPTDEQRSPLALRFATLDDRQSVPSQAWMIAGATASHSANATIAAPIVSRAIVRLRTFL
jgi:hypothetical protein